MNILFVYPRHICPRVGGVERVAQILADAFEARGNKVFYLSFHKQPTHSLNVENDGISSRQHFFPLKKSDDIFQTYFDEPENIEFFEIFLRERQINVIIAQLTGTDTKLTTLLRAIKHLKIPVIGCQHSQPNFIFQDEKQRTGIRKFFRERKILKRFREMYNEFDKYVVLSSANFPEVLKFLRGNVEKLTAISNPLTFPPTKIDLATKKNELLFVGRFYNLHKKVNWLLQIWAKIEKDFPDWILRIVGDGPDREEILELAGTLNLRERVEFCGFQDPVEFYKTASIFCMTSSCESFGMVLTEASAFACVPVAFNSFDAVHDIITNGENGMLVPAFDLDKYAGTLAKLMREHDLRERLARNAQENSKRFSQETIVSKWLQLFDELEVEK